jgi:hypothetical protein
MVYANSNAYSEAPGVIVGCGLVRTEQLVGEVLAEALAGTVAWGEAATVGVEEGYLDFIFDDAGFRDYVSPVIQEKMQVLLSQMKQGLVQVPQP